ncbi:hypothetical protein QNA08_04655 [Chelatococcus sp. SYSU_G07232]|uniref:Uncharacterized protein n=1 Tax=Chelatococcus albus TaxID=3047466 RepID=A0ABT7ADS2_9HYPH|nr:hypothetical protein [Chelatococcus sp. SYSU_G07232]MDJ1157529.1 hypothetical protein [Chelatococcus sp. SYSU_G07232]
MPLEPTGDERTDAARAELRQAIMAAFCSALHGSQLPPMTVMSLAAEAVGSIYREVADAHRSDHACPCGWRPSPEADVELLQAALAMTAQSPPAFDLRLAHAAGRA